jgi:hypothetical protein
MNRKRTKISAFTLTILLLMTSFVYAASHEAKQQRTSETQEQSSSTTSATVVTVDQDGGTFTVMSPNGKPAEFQASEAMLSNMQVGDVVEVSVRKLQSGQQSGTSGSQSSQPSSGQSR